MHSYGNGIRYLTSGLTLRQNVMKIYPAIAYRQNGYFLSFCDCSSYFLSSHTDSRWWLKCLFFREGGFSNIRSQKLECAVTVASSEVVKLAFCEAHPDLILAFCSFISYRSRVIRILCRPEMTSSQLSRERSNEWSEEVGFLKWQSRLVVNFL